MIDKDSSIKYSIDENSFVFGGMNNLGLFLKLGLE